MFKRKTFTANLHRQNIEPVAPEGESSISQTLPAYLAYLESSNYLPSTTEKYFTDVKKLSVILRTKKVEEITEHDLQQWISTLVSPQGDKLDRRTVNRKVSAIINYFSWLRSLEAITDDPTAAISNQRIRSPLPDYLYESECKLLYEVASKDPRTYLLVLLLLETGMKSKELFSIKISDIDTSDPYRPELWIKHKGKEVKKDRKVALPQNFMTVYEQYRQHYKVEDFLFPYTDRFVQMLFAELKKVTKIEKELTPKTLRHSHVVRAYKRGEDKEIIFDRIGLAPDSRQEADEVYSKLAGRGI